MRTPGFGGRMFTAVPILAVTVVSLLLLAFVGYGESSRVYPPLRLERIAALGEVVKHPIDVFAQTELSLRQYVGFDAPARSALSIDTAIREIAVVDSFGAAKVFSQGHPAVVSDTPATA